MKPWQLEAHLADVDIWDKPNFMLEQYPTSPHIAAQLIQFADLNHDDIADKEICDLGCGGGILGIAAMFMGAKSVTFVDIDAAVLKVAERNVAKFDMSEQATFLCGDITEVDLPQCDTVIMNPPFGTKPKARGIDVTFLDVASRIAPVVYSLHKTSTERYLLRKAGLLGCTGTVAAHVKFDIPEMYGFHKKKNMEVEVSLLRLERDEE